MGQRWVRNRGPAPTSPTPEPPHLGQASMSDLFLRIFPIRPDVIQRAERMGTPIKAILFVPFSLVPPRARTRGLPRPEMVRMAPDRGDPLPERTERNGAARPGREEGRAMGDERRDSPGSVGPGRGRRRMRPSWRTATSAPWRTHEATRVASASGRATSSRSSGGRPAGIGGGGSAPGTPTCRPSATRSPGRRRRSGSGVGSRPWRRAGRLCRALRARLKQMLALPPETPAVAPPEPAGQMPEALPEAVATPEEAEGRPDAGRRGGTA